MKRILFIKQINKVPLDRQRRMYCLVLENEKVREYGNEKGRDK
jgi:hypothetical protein